VAGVGCVDAIAQGLHQSVTVLPPDISVDSNSPDRCAYLSAMRENLMLDAVLLLANPVGDGEELGDHRILVDQREAAVLDRDDAVDHDPHDRRAVLAVDEVVLEPVRREEGERTGVEHHEVGALAHFDGADGAVENGAPRTADGRVLFAVPWMGSTLLGTTDTTLTADQIRALVADLARFDVFRLLEAAWNGQGAQTLRMLEGLRQEGEVIPALMGMVVSELKTTTALSEAATSGSLDRVFNERRVWPGKQAMYRRALERHNYRRWQRFLVEAGNIDRASKGRAAGDAWVQLQRLLVAIAVPGGIGLLRGGAAAA
jgi:hypothetical protein